MSPSTGANLTSLYHSDLTVNFTSGHVNKLGCPSVDAELYAHITCKLYSSGHVHQHSYILETLLTTAPAQSMHALVELDKLFSIQQNACCWL